jgi:Transglutaminase elicitor
VRRILLVGLMGALAVVGCSSSAGSDTDSSGSDIAWDPNTEDPAILVPNFVATVSKVITQDDTGKEFGLDDAHVPYPDTYWPFLSHDSDNKVNARNGIDNRWQGADKPSPLEKYLTLLDPSHMDEARRWEAQNHGEKVPGVADWFGHCPGWTAAAMFNAPIQHSISVRADSGEIVSCAAGEAGCVDFEVGDINGLEAEAFLGAPGGFLGNRCDTKPEDIQRDKSGRVQQPGCRGANPGALLVVLANRMKNVKGDPNFVPKAVAIDAQNEFNTDQIWNQPAFRYAVKNVQTLSLEDAIKLTVKAGKRGGLFGLGRRTELPKTYPWNEKAKGFLRVDLVIRWVKELGPNVAAVSGLKSAQQMPISAVIELDGDPAAPETRILGGEYLDDASTGSNRLTVPPFVWTVDAVRSDSDEDSGNPFVKPSAVQKLVKLAQ